MIRGKQLKYFTRAAALEFPLKDSMQEMMVKLAWTKAGLLNGAISQVIKAGAELTDLTLKSYPRRANLDILSYEELWNKEEILAKVSVIRIKGESLRYKILLEPACPY